MEWLRLVYAGSFTLAAGACLLSLRAVSRVESPDTRQGLAGLLALSGAWSGAHVARMIAPGPDLEVAAYMVGLTVGLATVGAWLYFCSAYTGHDYHRRPAVRQTALAGYVTVVGVKLTNPVHEGYFTTAPASEPFPHVAIQLSTVHWVVTGLAYALSAVGFYLLYETFSESRSDVRALGALVAATGLPIVSYLASLGSESLLTLHYEPLGVAVFAVGVLYVVDEEFVAVPRFWRDQVIDDVSEAVVLVDRESVVRDANDAAVELFPGLRTGVGEPLAAVAPELAAADDAWDGGDDRGMFVVERAGTTRYYLLDATDLDTGDVAVGRALVCTDVTEVERQRRELERQNEQFDDFAAAITHELRNTVTIAEGYLDLVTDELAGDASADSTLAAREIRDSLARMDRVVSDLSTLARYGQTLDSVDDCDLRSAAETGYEAVDTDGVELELVVATDATVAADCPRLVELFRSAIQFAALYGARTVTVDAGTSGFTITTDGESIDPAEAEAALSYGEAVPSAETGMELPTVRTLGRVHGWTVALDPEYREGVRLRVDGVDICGSPDNDSGGGRNRPDDPGPEDTDADADTGQGSERPA